MAKIQRNTQKIFGSNASADDIAVLGSFKSGTPVYTDNIAALQNAVYEEGYGAALVANEAPFMEEQNSIPYILSTQLAYTFQEGVPEYDPNTTYYKGSWCKSLTDNAKGYRDLYESLIDDNLGNPLNDTSAWKLRVLDGANQDLSNLTEAGESHFLKPSQKEEITGWAYPSTKSITLTPALNTPYTAPADGIFAIGGKATVTGGWVTLTNNSSGFATEQSDISERNGTALYILASKGQKVLITASYVTLTSTKFIYAKGESDND